MAARPLQVTAHSTSRWNAHQFALVGAAVAFFFVIVLVIQGISSGSRTPPPTWVQLHKQRLSSWINLPRPQHLGQVPEAWGQLRLMMKREELDSSKLVRYDSPDYWADVAYVPDPSKPEAFFGLSFHAGRLYKVAIRLGEESMVDTAPYVVNGTAAYGPTFGYEYLTARAPHIVTIFKTGSRALKLDSVRRSDELYLCEVILVDLDEGAARERERVRGRG